MYEYIQESSKVNNIILPSEQLTCEYIQVEAA